MEKNMKYIIAGFFTCLIFGSCKKNLDLAPQDTISQVTFFKTANDFKLFANQFYNGLPGFNSDDDQSDITTSLNNVSNSSYSTSPDDGIWNGYYGNIRNANLLMEEVTAAVAGLQPAIATYDGEARFFRAFAYYNLLKRFGGVPIIDKSLTLNDNLLYGPRNSRVDVVHFILADLEKAIAELPAADKIPAADQGRVTRGAALALKARICLFEGTWRKYQGGDGRDEINGLLDSAVSASGKIMQSGLYKLFDRRDVLGDDSYRYFFILDKKQSNPANLTKNAQSENIFVRKYDATIPGGAAGLLPVQPTPTKKMADMFLCEDGLPVSKSPLFKGYDSILTEYKNRDLRMKNFFLTPYQHFWSYLLTAYSRNWSNPEAGGEYFIKGFTSQTGYVAQKLQPEIALPSGVDYPLMRYSEILLIYAEAMFEKNGSINDADLGVSINRLRQRVGMPYLTNAFISANGLDMQTEIRRERTVELFLEGFRFDDLRRWKTAKTELSQDVLGIKYAGTQYQTDQDYGWAGRTPGMDAHGFIVIESAGKRQFQDRNYLFPIPTRQILLNPQLTQNPGW